MHPKSPKWLDDIADAAGFVVEITTNQSLRDYESDRRLRQVVERNFEIMGEALRRLERTDPATAARISAYRPVIDLRNRLAHQYDDIDNETIWDIIQRFLPTLHEETAKLVAEAERDYVEPDPDASTSTQSSG
jgi:uncharacterized protein with HEPN domain